MDIASLEKMIAAGRDSAMLRLTLARLLAREEQLPGAISHLEMAVTLDPFYTAAWKELGKLCRSADRIDAARSAWSRGIEVAHARGDKQAEKEMSVFVRRLDRV